MFANRKNSLSTTIPVSSTISRSLELINQFTHSGNQSILKLPSEELTYASEKMIVVKSNG